MRPPVPLPRPANRAVGDFFGSPKFKDFASNALMDLGYGLTRGTDLNQGFQFATQRTQEMQPQRDEYARMKAEEAARQQQIAEAAAIKDKYSAFFTEQGRPDIAQGIADGIVEPGAAYMDFIKPKTPAEAPSNVREWEYFTTLSPEQQSQYLTMKRSVPFLDQGTQFGRPDPVTGAVTTVVPKDNFTPAYDAKAGAGQAAIDVETEAAAASLESKLPGLRSVVGELGELAKTATYTKTGQLIDSAMRETGLEPGEAAVARTKYIAMVDNQILPLLRDTFGAAFTAKEGETLRATLGDPDKSPSEKQVILEAFIEQKARDLEALKSRIPGKASGGGAQNDPMGIR